MADQPAGGLPAVVATLRHAFAHMGARGALRALRRVNQSDGFDCPGCAWPDPRERGAVEFCENGAKAVAHAATRARAGPELFQRHPIAALAAQSDHWLEQQGRLTHPLWKRRGSDRYEPVSWELAFERVAAHLRALDHPDGAAFYTSGRTSNEAAFLYQLFVRRLGTNNLPDCSNMCHESSGTALQEVLGTGKGSVTLDDFGLADLILVIGQNPGTNHPRMLTTLIEARRRGATIVSVNPLREPALVSFAHPQTLSGLMNRGSPIAQLHVPVRVGGDQALFQGVAAELLALEAGSPGRVLDHDFIREHTEGFEAWREALAALDFALVERDSGIPRAQIRELARLLADAKRVIACWCMGITQHRNGVANVQEIVNLLLLRGQVGLPGAGPCPVRGHSNVQGDRTMGIDHRPKDAFLDALGAEFGFEPPRRPGADTLETLAAMEAGRVRVFFALGGNFAVATPDTPRAERALRRCALTAHVSTTLNRSHLVTGEEALVLPCLARHERDVQAGGPQFVTVENSMSVVHASRGEEAPASPHLRSEPAIVAGLARAVLGDDGVRWEALVADYDRIRERIARVVPGCEDMNVRVRAPGGFVLPNCARERRFDTPSGRARFSVHPLPDVAPGDGRFLLTTVRSHDQYNTTVYGLEDRYRGVRGDRRVVFLNPEDLRDAGLRHDQTVDLTSHFEDETRTLAGFRVRAFRVPRGCAVTYFPEANPLVPAGSFANGSRTPSYKSIAISIRPAAEAASVAAPPPA